MTFGIFYNGLAKSVARDAARKLAENFGKASDSTDTFKDKFNHMWDLTWKAKGYADDHHNQMVADVLINLNALSAIADDIGDGAMTSNIFGLSFAEHGKTDLRSYRTAAIKNRFVVFSDIHMTDDNNRQDFFTSKHNKDLYLDVLRFYYGVNDFALIENGDVEELLIHEPNLSTMPDYGKADWDSILDDREERKFAQFKRIVDFHADYYRTVNDHFIKRDAYYRTIGNHDYDLATEKYTDEIEDRLRISWPNASEMVALTRRGTPEILICHGHQFDAYCVGSHAAYAGESFSQGGAWAYQGPDRHWTLDKDGALFINKWLDGSKAFSNVLVSDDPALPATDANVAEALAGQLIGNLHDTSKWEALYGKNIAWEYFVHDDPQDAYNDEVESGDRWYKFRHMDETTIVARLEAQFGSNGLRLLLGHSHEPRLRAAKPSFLPVIPPDRPDCYMNSAAAGRFENLIWGIEIDDGVATMISWSRDDGSTDMIRTVWTDLEVAFTSALMATSRTSHKAEAPEVEEDPPYIPIPVTHMMFST